MVEMKDLMIQYTSEIYNRDYIMCAQSMERSYFYDSAELPVKFEVRIDDLSYNMRCMTVWYTISFEPTEIIGIDDYKVEGAYIDYRLLFEGGLVEPQPPLDYKMVKSLLDKFIEHMRTNSKK